MTFSASTRSEYSRQCEIALRQLLKQCVLHLGHVIILIKICYSTAHLELSDALH